MHAARLHPGATELAIETVERPELGPMDVLIDVQRASICGTDVHHLSGELPVDDEKLPLTLGHEGAGVVAETGSAVTNLEPGDRVVVDYAVACGHCEPCLHGYGNRCRNRRSVGSGIDGTFAEYLAVPASSAVPMPDAVPFEWGSIVACAVSTAFHAVQRAGIEPADDVVVFGVGGVGLHAVLFAAKSLVRTVVAVDLVDERLAAAEAYGADVVVNPSERDVVEAVRSETDGWGADVAIECSGSPVAMEQAVASVNGANRFESGTVVSVGYQENPLEAAYWDLREGQLTVSGDHTRAELRRLLSLLAAGKIDLDRSIAGTVPLAEINDGVRQITADETLTGRVVVDTT